MPSSNCGFLVSQEQTSADLHSGFIFNLVISPFDFWTYLH